jgi:cyclophilin family peptidyl-prolyl cis-trans isomerase
MRKILLAILYIALSIISFAQKETKLKKRDRKKDVELITDYGNIVIRLSDSTPLHRDNFLKLAKKGYYDSALFHRVINQFMIQSGDPQSKRAEPRQPLGIGEPGYTVPAEFRYSLFHKKGAVAAARMGDALNPKKESSGSQFYIVQGKPYTDEALNAIETRPSFRGRKIPADQREVYKTAGGTPSLDQNYTVFGQVVSGLEIVDKIAAAETSHEEDADRPLKDIRIIKAKLVKRKGKTKEKRNTEIEKRK